eukprot:CAMPEP_0115123006 /NCGR_PEP_ID=MMETSP0227-20121206/47190_1 /TAXON_ID=89957 /ORGANISM="Polarella glacialis, Strain CCMP 1383" /LENGTH=48 /DNA_ID= /DNA_START= /DNA_END= /DNA_ORIENTATION=
MKNIGRSRRARVSHVVAGSWSRQYDSPIGALLLLGSWQMTCQLLLAAV